MSTEACYRVIQLLQAGNLVAAEQALQALIVVAPTYDRPVASYLDLLSAEYISALRCASSAHWGSIPTGTRQALCDAAASALSEQQPRRILDEREVMKLAREAGLKKFMYDTEGCRLDLARFAHIVDQFQRQFERPDETKEPK